MKLDQTYFFWGCGQPIQFGLYSPVMDRLVFVDDNSQLFEYVIFLLSNKIRLLIVPLHCAPNFQIDMIDNTCCTNWSITDWPPESLNKKFNFPKNKRTFLFDTCGKLIEKSNKDLTEIQNFIFLSYRVLKLFQFSENYQYRIVSKLIKLPFRDFDQLKEIESECNQTIYLVDSYAEAKEKIELLCKLAEGLF
jgi:hypothetical protein